MSVAWFRVNTDLVDHPKLAILEARLGPEATKILLRVWTWAARLRRDGAFRPGEVDLAARCAASAALIEAGFLESDGVTLHDWLHHNGTELSRLPEKREKHAERMRQWREKRETSPLHPPPPENQTRTATATATGDMARDIARDVSRDVSHMPNVRPNTRRTDEMETRGKLPHGADTLLTASWREYRMAAGIDGFDAFCRQVRAMEAKGILLAAAMTWLKANPGSHVYEARDALVPPPARPPPRHEADALDEARERRRKRKEAEDALRRDD